MTRYKRREELMLQHVRCPECGVPMMNREGYKGKFYGCSRFPLCIGTRPQGSGEPDSYTALLRVAYSKAVLFLSSPKFMGYADASRWLLDQAMEHEVTDEEFTSNTLDNMANEHLERGIEAASAWVSEKTGDFIDFMLNAHEARYASVRARLKFITTAEQIKRMPKPEIVRSYDTSNLSQFEADLASNWQVGGKNCPRCGGWCSPLVNEARVELTRARTVMVAEDLTDEMLADLFADTGLKPVSITMKWECGRCGVFARITTKSKGDISERFEFDNDKNDPTVVQGVAFKPPPPKDKTK